MALDAKHSRLTLNPPGPTTQFAPKEEVAWSPDGDVLVRGPGWVWDRESRIGHVWSDRAGTFQLPALPGTTAGKVRFVDPILTVKRNASRTNIIATSPDGAVLPHAGEDARRLAPDTECSVLRDIYGVAATPPPVPQPPSGAATCRAEITLITTPSGLYRSIEVDLPITPRT